MKDPGVVVDWGLVSWPASRLGEAIEWLARSSGLSRGTTRLQAAAPLDGDHDALHAWIEAASGELGLEAEPVDCTYGEVEGLIRNCGPALLQVRCGAEDRFVAVVARGRVNVCVLGLDLKTHRLPATALRAALCQQFESPMLAATEGLLEQVGLSARRRSSTMSAILREQLGGTRIGGCWLLRLPPGAGSGKQFGALGVPRLLFGLLGAHTLEYAFWLLAWWMIGRAALEGHFDGGWMAAWALVVFGMIPFRLLATWWQGLLAIRIGSWLKRRLLSGALQLEPEEIRHQGTGQLLGCVIESGAVESLALSGGLLGLVTVIELLLAAGVMALGVGGGWLVVLLGIWLAGTLLVAGRYFQKREWWTRSRVEITNDLVERMAGHRTRLAQEAPERWHQGEDQSISGLLAHSLALDQSAARLLALVPRGWLLAALAVLGPAFVMPANPATATGLAVSLGGVLLAFRALQRFAAGLSHLAGAAVAWKQTAPIFRAAARFAEQARPVPVPESPAPTAEAGPMAPLLEAHELGFQYRGRGQPVLRDCTLSIRPGDRIILEGPSGAGKSTLASLLAGLREPHSGLLLLGGLDRHSVGLDGWRRRVAAAPQFHENHVLTGTFAYNLLMGRRWPPRDEDVQRAEAVCRELKLGELLNRMPAGLWQQVGETGWQLSHGERSRLYIARALLQRAGLVILDESFAALDPATLREALGCVIARAPTLLVIAHP